MLLRQNAPCLQVFRNNAVPRIDGRNGFVFELFLMPNSQVATAKVRRMQLCASVCALIVCASVTTCLVCFLEFITDTMPTCNSSSWRPKYNVAVRWAWPWSLQFGHLSLVTSWSIQFGRLSLVNSVWSTQFGRLSLVNSVWSTQFGQLK